MMVDPVLQRFAAHLTLNPWVRSEFGGREMLAGRPLDQVRMIELNGVLARYVAVGMSRETVDRLPVRPTITVDSHDDRLTHCLWELADAVTLTRQGRSGPKRFLHDVELAIVARAKACAGGLSKSVRVLRKQVYCPIYPAYSVMTNDVVFSLRSLRQSFDLDPASGQNDGPTYAGGHYRSGKDADIFDAARAVAAEFRQSATSALELAAQLKVWSSSAEVVKQSAITPSELEALIGRVAGYMWTKKRPAVARGTRGRIEHAARVIARDQRVDEADALLHLRKPIAAMAGVSERAVRRASKG